MRDTGPPDDGVPGSAGAPWERTWGAGGPPSRRRTRHDDDAISVAELLERSSGAPAGTAAEPDDTPDTPAAPDTPVTPLPTTRTRRRAATAGKVAVALAAAAALGVTGTAWGLLHYVDSGVRQVEALDSDSSAIQEPAAQLGDENFLLVGSDTRQGASGDVGAGNDTQVEGARSDTTMIAHIPADRSRVVIVSFPRDLQVDLPACAEWDNATGTYSDQVAAPREGVKLNEAYLEGGPRCITKVVQQLSGLSVNHFLGVDFSGFESMVDAVDGVEVCSERPLRDSVLGDVLPRAGTQTLDGAQALSYVRARHVVGDPTSDYGRITRQQRFLSSLLRATLSSDTLLNVGRVTKLVDAVRSSTFGERVDVQDLLPIAESLDSLQAGRVTFITAPTTGRANAAGNEVLRTEDNAALFQAVRDGAALPGEEAATTSPSTPGPSTPGPSTPGSSTVRAVAPSTVSLRVVNATETSGLAAAVTTTLQGVGWPVAGTGSEAVSGSGSTVVRYSAGQEAAAATVASSVPGATTVLTPGLGATVELVLAGDVRATIVAPSAPGSALALTPGSATTTTPALPDDLTVVNGGDTTCG